MSEAGTTTLDTETDTVITGGHKTGDASQAGQRTLHSAGEVTRRVTAASDSSQAEASNA